MFLNSNKIHSLLVRVPQKIKITFYLEESEGSEGRLGENLSNFLANRCNDVNPRDNGEGGCSLTKNLDSNLGLVSEAE
jgi:hypothetical protein